MTVHSLRRAGVVAASGLLIAGLAACGSDEPEETDTGADSEASGEDDAAAEGGDGEAFTIALLLPESKTTRYEAFDRPLFEAAIAEQCPDCTVIYSNADQDPAQQQEQAEAALAQGIDVMVLDVVDATAGEAIVNNAKTQGVPVVAYDRLVAGADYYVSFDNAKVGELQAQTLLDILEAEGTTSGDIVMVNGSPTDGNATLFKEGAHGVLDASEFNVVAEFDTPDWSPDAAQEWMEGQLSALDMDNVVGVYAANDGTAGGAITAMKGGGIDPLPPVTGQDAELAGIQRIVAGDQALTIYKAIVPEAEDAATAALALARGEAPASSSELEGVPSTLLDPVAVTADNIMDTVVADGFYTVEDICTAEYADACAELGIE
jgi:D-xylose transport system substrate-binding protein